MTYDDLPEGAGLFGLTVIVPLYLLFVGEECDARGGLWNLCGIYFEKDHARNAGNRLLKEMTFTSSPWAHIGTQDGEILEHWREEVVGVEPGGWYPGDDPSWRY